jgi:hypothetical protein
VKLELRVRRGRLWITGSVILILSACGSLLLGTLLRSDCIAIVVTKLGFPPWPSPIVTELAPTIYRLQDRPDVWMIESVGGAKTRRCELIKDASFKELSFCSQSSELRSVPYWSKRTFDNDTDYVSTTGFGFPIPVLLEYIEGRPAVGEVGLVSLEIRRNYGYCVPSSEGAIIAGRRKVGINVIGWTVDTILYCVLIWCCMIMSYLKIVRDGRCVCGYDIVSAPASRNQFARCPECGVELAVS